MKVIHLIPDSAVDPKHFHLGSTKDVRGRTEYFKARGVPFDEIPVSRRSDVWLLEKLQGMDLSQYTSAVFELTRYPASLRFLRQHSPQLKLLSRPINAEFYQRLHQLWASIPNPKILQAIKTAKANLLLLRSSLYRLWLDYACARRSDYILSISRWDKENYFSYFAGASRVKNVPYFLPNSYSQLISPAVKKKHQCVCLMSTTAATPFLLDAARSFMRLVERLGRECPEWNFVITGDFPANAFTLPERVTPTDFLDTPFTILAESRAIALLSDYGFGFKTKVLDAIQNKCYVLVTGKLYQRLPVEVQPYCIVVNKHSVDSFKSALERCLQPYPDGNPNDVLRSQAFAALDELLLR
jgi:hypothetical protein